MANKMKNGRIPIGVHLSVSMAEELEKIREETLESVSTIVRTALTQYIKEYNQEKSGYNRSTDR